MTVQEVDVNAETDSDIVEAAQQLAVMVRERNDKMAAAALAVEEVNKFKALVVSVSHEFADEKKWCSEFDEWMDGIGLDVRGMDVEWYADVVAEHRVVASDLFTSFDGRIMQWQTVRAKIRVSGTRRDTDCVCEDIDNDQLRAALPEGWSWVGDDEDNEDVTVYCGKD